MKKLMISMMMVMFLTGCVGNAIMPDEPQSYDEPQIGVVGNGSGFAYFYDNELTDFGIDIIGIGAHVGVRLLFENSKQTAWDASQNKYGNPHGADFSSYIAKIRFENSKLELQGESK